MTSIDELDVEILARLSADARQGIAELAAGLGVSRATVQLRIKRLEDEKILLGFQPIVNLAGVDLALEALVTLEIDQRLMKAIVDGLRELPEVLEVRIQAGREDLLVRVAVSSLEHLQVLTASIVEIEGVRKTTSTFTVSTPVPFRVMPVLRKITRGSGWGRSTPAPASAG